MAITYTFEQDATTINGVPVWADVSITVPNPCDKLVVFFGVEDASATIGTLSTVTVGGNALAVCNDGTTTGQTNSNVSGSDGQRAEAWYIDNPPTGVQTLAMTGTGPINATAHVISYYLVGTADGAPEAVALLASGANPSVCNITTLSANAFVHGTFNAGAAVTISGVGTDETLDGNASQGGSRNGTVSEIKSSSGANSLTVDWSGNPVRVAGVVVAWAEAAGAGGGGGAYYRKRRSISTGGRGL